jgi:hypothetical protein
MFSASAQEDQSHNGSQGEHAQDNKKQPGYSFSLDIRLNREKDEPKADWTNTKCGQPQTHDEADLCEQRRMAKSAEDTVWLNRLQTGLGVIGAFILFVTLALTIWATRAAIKSADAAHASVRLAEKTAEQQLRAYVTITEAEIRTFWSYGDPTFAAFVIFKNSGQTPAYDFRVWVGAEICRHDEPPFAKIYEGDSSMSILGPDLTVHTTSKWEPVAGMREQIALGGYRIFVWGQARYVSIGETRTFTFRAWNSHELKDDADPGEDWGGWTVVPHPMGYEST